MTSQPLDDAGDLAAALERLERRIDALDRTVQARASEAEALSPLIERVVTRVSDIRTSVGAIQPQIDRANADIESVRTQEDETSRSLREVLAAMADLERRLDTSQQDSGLEDLVTDRTATLESSLRDVFAHMAEIDRRLDESQPGTGLDQVLGDRIAALEAREQPQAADGVEENLIERIAQLESRINGMESDGQAIRDRATQIEQRLYDAPAGAESQVETNEARLEQAERSIESLNAVREFDLPAALSRIDILEAQIASLRSQLQTGTALPSVPAPAEGADQHALQVLREESIGVAMASVNDLYRRVDQLERQEEALSRIINLIVERSRLLPDKDLAGEGGKSR
jgi:chromosome segregation ATPase